MKKILMFAAVMVAMTMASCQPKAASESVEATNADSLTVDSVEVVDTLAAVSVVAE